MKIAIMQPYFLPYLGYFTLLKHTDRFIFLDDVQFIRHGWIERNRILKPASGWQYIKIPLVKIGQKILIKDLQINNSIDWQNKILRQIEHYKKKAPNYDEVVKLLKSIFEVDSLNIVDLNKRALEIICDFLGFPKKIEIFSRMNLKISDVKSPDDWALNICKEIGSIDEYWNASGGKIFFDKSKFKKEKIDLKFCSTTLTEYNQRRNYFEAGLSIIDVLMFNSVEDINKMLDNYEFI
ncbi:MAG: WbqC family protein [Patescibacteria group bacterium]|jgi:hypothetical protein